MSKSLGKIRLRENGDEKRKFAFLLSQLLGIHLRGGKILSNWELTGIIFQEKLTQI
jgi:hypothetical protein